MRLPSRTDAPEGGFTLVETALTVLLVAVVMAAAFPVVPVFFREANTVQNTYGAVDQLVLASEVVTRYIHEAVDPAPSSSTYPFVSASANSVTFFANTGLSTGPEEVIVSVSSGTAGTRTFQAYIRSPIAGTCPIAGTSAYPNGTCSYSSTATKSILLINYLTNGTAGNPVFTYTLQGGGTCGGTPTAGTLKLKATISNGATIGPNISLATSSGSVALAQGDVIDLGSGSSAQSVVVQTAKTVTTSTTSVALSTPYTVANQTYSSGSNAVFDSTCNATQVSEIEAVSLSLQATKNPSGLATGYQSLAYLFSPNYSSAVG